MRLLAWATLAALHGMLALSASAQGRAAQRPSVADRSEVGLQIGATVTPSVGLRSGGAVDHNPSLALGAEYDYRLGGRRTALYAGVDFLASPLDVKSSQAPQFVSPQYAYLFLTPHVRVKWNASGRLEPWLELGGGYANFAPAQPVPALTRVTGSGSTGALVVGGGLDSRPLVHVPLPLIGRLGLGTRVEVRDFLSGQPKYGVPVSSDHLNTVAITGGLLLRF